MSDYQFLNESAHLYNKLHIRNEYGCVHVTHNLNMRTALISFNDTISNAEDMWLRIKFGKYEFIL
jgi:hypothetical protein